MKAKDKVKALIDTLYIDVREAANNKDYIAEAEIRNIISQLNKIIL